MKPFNLEIITPSKTAFTGEVNSVNLPGVLGEFQVLYNHAPMMSSLEIGKIRLVDAAGNEVLFATSGGVAEVLKNKVLVLSNAVETPAEIDAARAEQAAERAKERLQQRSNPDIDISRAEIALARALNRIKISKM
jgi:F-type H+-transporting ATPase subunit epsilon